MESLPVILVFAFIAALLGYSVWRRYFYKKKTAARRMQDIINTLTAQTVVAGGALVLSQTELTNTQLQGIEAAFAEMRENATRSGYTQGFDPHGCTILMFPAAREYDSNGNYSPSFQVFFNPGDPYDGSIYDQEPDKAGGWLYAAEQVLDPAQRIFVIAESNDREYVRASVYNGLDHIVLYHSDRPRYNATLSHADGGGHPIIT